MSFSQAVGIGRPYTATPSDVMISVLTAFHLEGRRMKKYGKY